MSIPTSLNLPIRVLEEAVQSAAASDAGPDLNRYLLVTAGMVVVIGALGWFFQKTMASSLRARAEKRSLRIVDVLPMGGKRKLAVVKVYDRTFVVGLGDKEISLISELDASSSGREELSPKGSEVKPPGLARAFEAIRSRVGEGKPKPQPKEATPTAKPGLAATLTALARPNSLKQTTAAKRAPSPSGLGDGRGLLG